MTRDMDGNHFTLAPGGPSRRAFGGLMGAGALIAAGCGGGGDGGSTTPPVDGGPSNPPPAVTPPQITAQPAAQQVNQQGQTVRFSVQASGDGLRYQWRRNGVDIAGANASVYEWVAQAADDGAQFSVIVSNSAGTVTSNAAALTVGLSFNVAAAVRNLLNTSSVLSATGSAGAYEYRLDSAAQTDIRGTQIRTLMITPTLVGSNEYPFYRVFTFGLDGRMLSMGHTTFYNQAFLIRRDVDGWGDVTSQQDLPQSAKPGASGVWFTTRNRYLFADTAGAETGTTTFSFTLEADGETTALLRLKESTLDKATAATLTGEYVLRITAAGEVTPVSDSSTIRSTVLQVDPLAKPMFAVANVVQAFLASQFEHVVDGVTYKLARSSRGLDWVTSLSASTGTDMVQWRYTWNFSFDQGPRMIRTDRSSGSVATFNPEISEEAGLVSSSPRLPAAAAVGTTGIWFVADNVTTAGSSGTTTATFSLEPDTAATALLKLKVRTVSTTGSVRNGEVVLRISQTGLLALDTDKAILSLFNPT